MSVIGRRKIRELPPEPFKRVRCKVCGKSKQRRNFYNAPRSLKPNAKCKDCIRVYSKARHKRLMLDPKFIEKKKLWARQTQLRKFGISEIKYSEMLVQQNSVCAICFKPETRSSIGDEKPMKLAVDHCHITGNVRGLLCNACNTALGQFNESPQTLRSAIHYLESYGRF